MAGQSSKPSPFALLIAKLGLQAEKVNVVEAVKELMTDVVTRSDPQYHRQHQRLSHYISQIPKSEPEIISDAILAFFPHHSAERKLIDQAIAGVDSKDVEVKSYFIALLMVALLQNRKVIDDTFVDHSSEFSYLINKLVVSLLGANFLEKFKPFVEHCQAAFNNKHEVVAGMEPRVESSVSFSR